MRAVARSRVIRKSPFGFRALTTGELRRALGEAVELRTTPSMLWNVGELLLGIVFALIAWSAAEPITPTLMYAYEQLERQRAELIGLFNR